MHYEPGCKDHTPRGHLTAPHSIQRCRAMSFSFSFPARSTTMVLGRKGHTNGGGKGGSRASLGLRARGGCQGMTCSADLGQEGYAVKKRMRSMKMCFVRVHGREWGVPYPFQIAKPSPGYLDCSLVLI